MKLKVLLLISNWNEPSELFIHHHIEMLAEEGYLEAIGCYREKQSFFYHDIPVLGLRPKRWWLPKILDYVYFRLTNMQRNVADSIWLHRQIGNLTFEVIFCEYASIAVLYRHFLIDSQVPIFVHVHGYDIHNHSPSYFKNIKKLEPYCYFISNSNWTTKQLIDLGLNPDRIILKYIGVEVPDTAPEFESDPEEIIILHLGRLVDFKAPHLTIRAFEIACEKGLNGRLIIAGDGDLRKKCEDMRAQSAWSERIQILGSVSREEGERLRKKAHIFTQHSVVGEQSGRTENYGVSIVEAMAAALPVVSCGLGGVIETVLPEETGILIEPTNVYAQADAFLRLAQNPQLRYAMGHKGWLRAKEHFSLEKEKSQLIEILNKKID